MQDSSISVPNAEGVPRLSDVVLLLCGKAIALVWPSLAATNPSACEALATWYLQRVAFINNIPQESSDGRDSESPNGGARGGEANFSMAFNALCNGPSALQSRATRQPRERSSSVPTVFGFTDRTSAASTAATPTGHSLDCGGFTYFDEFLDLCRDVASIVVCEEAQGCIVKILTQNGRLRSPADVLPSLTTFLSVQDDGMDVEQFSSITRSFATWVQVSWSCASFAWQAHIASAMGDWLNKRETQRTTASYARPPRLHPTSSAFHPAMESTPVPNMAAMHAAMRRICEGRALNERSLIESLVQSGVAVQLPDHNVMDRMAGEPSQPQQDSQQSHHAVLLSITSGVLLYAQFYLSVRSLDAAQHCTRMAVLVGHQWRSNELLVLAHYSSFLVHVSCQDAPAAAGDVAILLQLADAATQSDADSPRHLAGCLGYMGTALLLLIAPGTVDTSLRSVIITGTVPGEGNDTLNGSDEKRGGGYAVSSGGQSSVVVQSIAQTVRHALWLSEMESFLDPSATLATELFTGVTRETMMVMAGYYGVRSAPRVMNAAMLGALLAQLDAAAATRPPRSAERPSVLLLRDALRQTAHRALAAQVGTADAPPGGGPFHTMHDFLLAVAEHYGEAGTQVVRSNFFFSSTYRFMCAMWLRNHGYIKSAYQELTRLADSMLFHSRSTPDANASSSTSACPAPVLPFGGYTRTNPPPPTTAFPTCASPPSMSASGTPCAASGEALGSTGVGAGLHFWPPDHLLLWQHIQYERAQLAHYLGYSTAIPAMAEALRGVSVASHFAMGVLYAELIAAWMCSQRGNHAGALDLLDRVARSAEAMGLTHVRTESHARRVSVLLTCGRWREALGALRAMGRVPLLLRPWLLLAKLHAEWGVAAAPERPALLEQHAQRLEDTGCFAEETAEADSVGVALTEKVCVLACVARLAAATDAPQRDAWDASFDTLAHALRRRQQQEGKWQLLCNMSMRRVCRDVLSGALLKQLLQSP